MADEKKPKANEDQKEPTIEEQAVKDGKLQPGYEYKYVTERGENGERITRKVYSKVGQ